MISFHRTSHRTRGVGAMLAVTGLALTAACGASGGGGNHNEPAPAATTNSSHAASGAHNSADVSFATDMIPHHSQAVEMADLALAKATDSDIKSLAATIKGAQAPEILKMTGWLKAWGAPVPSTGSGSAMQTGMAGMAGTGMMSDAEMTSLSAASGSAFDKMWVQMMTRHHQGAVDMAKTELASGRNSDATALAGQIVTAQTAEIAEMAAIAKRLG